MVPAAIDHDYEFLRFISDLEAGREHDLDRYAILEEHFLEEFFPSEIAGLLEIFWGPQVAEQFADWGERYYELVKDAANYRLEPILQSPPSNEAWRKLVSEARVILSAIDAYVPPDELHFIFGGNFLFLPLKKGVGSQRGLWISNTNVQLDKVEPYFAAKSETNGSTVLTGGVCATQFGTATASLVLRGDVLKEVTLTLSARVTDDLLASVEGWIAMVRNEYPTSQIVARIGATETGDPQIALVFTLTG